MKRLLCKLLGHKWEAVTKDEIDNYYTFYRRIVMAKCERCGIKR